MPQALRRGLPLFCPVCDRHEVVGRDAGVHGNSAAVVVEARFLRHVRPRVTVFLEGGRELLAAAALRTTQRGRIGLVVALVMEISLSAGRICMAHAQGPSLCDSLYCALGLRVQNACALRLGARCYNDGHLLVDARDASTAPGLYAADDVALGLNRIAGAAGDAAVAGQGMHRALLRAGPKAGDGTAGDRVFAVP